MPVYAAVGDPAALASWGFLHDCFARVGGQEAWQISDWISYTALLQRFGAYVSVWVIRPQSWEPGFKAPSFAQSHRRPNAAYEYLQDAGVQ